VGEQSVDSFYHSDAKFVEPFDFTRTYCENLGARFLSLDEINRIKFRPMFEIFDCCTARPVEGNLNIVLPGAFDDHDAMKVDGRSLTEIMEQYVSDQMPGLKYIFYADRSFAYAVESSDFTYDLLCRFSVGYVKCSFFVFSAQSRVQVAFEEDLHLVAIAQQHSGGISPVFPGGRNKEFWDDYFRQQFAKMIHLPYQWRLDLFNQHYQPRLPSIEIQKYPPDTKVL
jgi:hypothetical protein